MDDINMLKILWQTGSFQPGSFLFTSDQLIYIYIHIHLRLYAQKNIIQRTSFNQGEYHLNDALLTAWAQTPFQRGRLTRLNVWGLVVQWSLCSWSFCCFHVSDLTQVFVAGATARVCWLYFTNLRFVSDSVTHAWALPAWFLDTKPQSVEPMMLLLIRKAVRVHVGQVDRAARVAYLNRSDQFWTLRRQIAKQSDALHLSSLLQTVLLRISTASTFALCPWYVALAVLVAEPWLTRMVCLRASRPDSFLLTLCRCGIPSTHELTQSEQLRADRVLFGQRAFTPGFESIIVGQYLPLAAPQESFLLRDAMQSSAQALRLGLEQVSG